MNKFLKTGLTALFASATLVATGCASIPEKALSMVDREASVVKTTKTQLALQALPPPSSKVTVAVYGFTDKTGQFKPTDSGQTLSRAVSQGGDEVLIGALQDAGLRSWFTVIERSNLNNLLKERQIITEMRSRYLGETQVNSQALPPLLFAGVILEGGIVGYDTNTTTGGAAARYLGIGGRTDYRQNIVTVHLRAVSVKTGEVLASVTTEKTIASIGVAANAFRFVTFDNLLEVDTGFTSNEPGLMALRQAVEKSVYNLVMEGSEIGLWSFADGAQGMALLDEYQKERGGYSLSPNVKLASRPTVQAAPRQQAAAPRHVTPVPAPKPVAAAPAPKVAVAHVVTPMPMRAVPTQPVQSTALAPVQHTKINTTARHRAIESLQLIEGGLTRALP